MNELGIDQIASIGFENVINPKNLTCSICYCLYTEGRECLNKKCKKIFCLNCVNKKFSSTNVNNNICPFCRTDAGFTILDENFINILNKIKIFCKREICNGLFTLSEYKEHIEQCKFSIKKTCLKCKNFSNLLMKCEICSIINCNECRNISKCYNCKSNICKGCTNSGQDFLCKICEINCINCNKFEADNVCYLCKKFLCLNCSMNCEECKYFICKDSDSCYKANISQCKYCSNIPLNDFYNKCHHLIYSECTNCYSRCENDFKHLKSTKTCHNITNKICNSCNKKICITNCASKCTNCREFNCYECFIPCSICKKNNCANCLIKCDRCEYNGIVSCNECNIDIIRKCSRADCNTRLCLECWNVCESCKAMYCDKHSFNCIKCEEKCCENHFHLCATCSNSNNSSNNINLLNNYRKLCMKNCTNICSFCRHTTNELCYSDKHQGNLVSQLNCGHNICKNCLTKCRKCQNIAVTCPKCIVNYYFHKCRRCDCFLCSKCSIYCGVCEDVFCSLDHKCDFCENIFSNTCLNCLSVRRYKCPCGQKFQNCEKCSMKLACRYKCGEETCENQCKMFYCNDECYKKFMISEEPKEFNNEDQLKSNCVESNNIYLKKNKVGLNIYDNVYKDLNKNKQEVTETINHPSKRKIEGKQVNCPCCILY